ncbi:TPA: hypothetical protein DCR49_08375 [Candidatus Delongbacteria bacterium]|nr:hypothetical protein [Candidatus Delongbacteria bacterium]
MLNGDPITELSAIYVYRNFDLIYTINNPIAGNPESYTDIVSATGNYTYKVVGVNSQGYGINARIDLPAGELFADGAGTETDPYLVSTADQLNNVRYFTDRDSVYFKQTDTIELGVAPWNEGKGWIPIGHDESEFMGSFIGNTIDCTIDNLAINDSTRYYASLFGAVHNAEIDDVHLKGVNILGIASCGALAGVSIRSKITACSTEGTVVGVESEIGGLIGASIDDSITVCYSNIDVTGNNGIGGLIGLTVENTVVKNCYACGDVEGYENVGGLIGVNFTSVPTENCYSTGFVSGSNYIGGLLSQSDYYPIHCYWDIETSGESLSPFGEGRKTADMTFPYSDSTYVGWDFENVWIQGWPTKYDNYPLLRWQTFTSIENDYSTPDKFTLSQNYPNPFNPVTKISYSIPQGFSGDVKLSIYNANGQLVKELVNEKKSFGIYSVEFNSEGLNSGMYFYRLKTANSDISKKMILLK